jgi:hypothetical protein
MRFTGTGNIGIGTTTPGTNMLAIGGGASSNFRLAVENSATGSSGTSPLANFTNQTDADLQISVTKSGATLKYAIITPSVTSQSIVIGTNSNNVGINTTNPPLRLTVAQDMTNDVSDITAGQFMVCGATTANKRLVIGYDTNGNGYGYIESGYLGNTWTYTALQGTGGNVVIGQLTDPGYKLAVNGQPGANGYTAWTNYSDLRLKENITDLDATNVLSKISSLRPVTFNYNELSGYNEATRSRRISGFIAQELKEIFPEMIGTIKINDTEYFDTDTSNLQLYLVKAIQELKAEIDELKNK